MPPSIDDTLDRIERAARQTVEASERLGGRTAALEEWRRSVDRALDEIRATLNPRCRDDLAALREHLHEELGHLRELVQGRPATDTVRVMVRDLELDMTRRLAEIEANRDRDTSQAREAPREVRALEKKEDEAPPPGQGLIAQALAFGAGLGSGVGRILLPAVVSAIVSGGGCFMAHYRGDSTSSDPAPSAQVPSEHGAR